MNPLLNKHTTKTPREFVFVLSMCRVLSYLFFMVWQWFPWWCVLFYQGKSTSHWFKSLRILCKCCLVIWEPEAGSLTSGATGHPNTSSRGTQGLAVHCWDSMNLDFTCSVFWGSTVAECKCSNGRLERQRIQRTHLLFSPCAITRIPGNTVGNDLKISQQRRALIQ